MRRNNAAQVALRIRGRQTTGTLAGPIEGKGLIMVTSTTAKGTKKKAKATTAESTSHTAEAKSRFNAALDEAKAGAAELAAEAKERSASYRETAKARSENWTGEAKAKAGELAAEGKTRASDALSQFGKFVGENAGTIDEKLGAKYGDYARSASRNLQETATKLDNKSVDEIGEDAREFVRKSPGLAVGLAAVAGFMLARLFRSR
jgi:ElaB/YqjD/DUF883 family membrane-anchored ribosome-binding protein